MFLNTSHLPQVLPPNAYYALDQYERELSGLFLPGWHCVGTLSDLRGEGDYLTTELFGRPLLIYRTHGNVRCFVNVCAHRFALLTSKPCGHMETLRCQYHGWEYDDSGHTRKIPDARSFRPMQDGQLRLTEVRAQTCGQLIFVSFAEEGPKLAEYLGEEYARCGTWFSKERKQILRRAVEIDANWKVKIENTLESYHIDCVHLQTFQRSPAAENCSHTLDDSGSLFATVEPPASRRHRIADKFVYGLMGLERDSIYKHVIHHPNFMFGRAGIFTWVEVVMPISPTRSRVELTMFCQPSRNRNPIAQLTQYWVARLGSRFALRALEEDLAIVVDVQRGLQSATQPVGGLISIREERIFHFQQYIQRTVGAGENGRPATIHAPMTLP